jgi:hypothetical protein
MIKKVKIHTTLFLLMFLVFVAGALVFKRDYSIEEWLEVLLIYLLITLLVFVINLLNNKWVKWIIVSLLYLIPQTILFWGGLDNWDISSIDVYMLWGKITVPFLPDNIPFTDNLSINTVLIYILFLLFPLIYWYGLYYVSKMLVKKLDLFYQNFK